MIKKLVSVDELYMAFRRDIMGGLNYDRILKEAKPVNAISVRHGQWNCSDDVYESAVCSICGWDTAELWAHIKEWFQFCPNCGADMRGDRHD